MLVTEDSGELSIYKVGRKLSDGEVLNMLIEALDLHYYSNFISVESFDDLGNHVH